LPDFCDIDTQVTKMYLYADDAKADKAILNSEDDT